MIKKLVEEFVAVERQLHDEIGCNQNLDTIKFLDKKIQGIYKAICDAPIKSNLDQMVLISFHLDRLCAANDQISQSKDMREIRRAMADVWPMENQNTKEWSFDIPYSKVSNIA